MTGTIKKLLNGFGFISMVGERKDHFFHATQVQNIKFNELMVNDKVEFEEEDSPKGKIAVNVNLVS